MEEVALAKRELPDAVFRQEYEAEFIFGTSAVFGEFSLYQTAKTWTPEPRPDLDYYFGIDWSGTGDDATVLTIIDENGRVALVKELMDENLNDRALAASRIIKHYYAKGFSETNGLGLGATEILEANSSNVYRFTTTNESKQELIKEFMLVMAEKKIELPSVNICPKLDNQMATFQVKRTITGKLSYSHIKGGHDDYVDSLLLANHARMNLAGNLLSFYSYEDVA
jgi:hypothetical protein